VHACQLVYFRALDFEFLTKKMGFSVPEIMGFNYQMTRKLKGPLDPSDIMSPGIAFLD
jgi:hypothetical protein